MDPLSLLLVLLVLCIVLVIARIIINIAGLPDPIGTVIYLIIVLLCVIWVFGGGGHLVHLR